MTIITYDELISDVENNKNVFIIDNFILSNTSIIIAAKEKVGKTSLCLQLAKAISENEHFLDFPKDSYHIDAILIYSNDSVEKSIMLKLQKMKYTKNPNLPIYFIFNKTITIAEIEKEIALKIGKDKRLLVIVDVLCGLRINNDIDLNNYVYMSDMIDCLEASVKRVTKEFGIVFLHHLNKSNSILGSRAIASRVSATLNLTIDNLTHNYGVIDIQANDITPRKIYIKKDQKNHKWVVDSSKNEMSELDVDCQLLKINEALFKSKDKKISGNVNEIVAITKCTISPKRLTRWLKTNKRYLNQNNICFEKRKSGTTILDIYYKA